MSKRSGRMPRDIGGKLTEGHPMSGLIDRAYDVFGGPKPHSLGVCENCCMDSEIEADFLRPDIRELPLRYVQDWYCAAVANDFPFAIWRYLLPRILEILMAGEDPASVGIEVVFKRHPSGEPAGWKPEQWAVLDEFQRSFLPMLRVDALDDLLCMFANSGWSLDSLQEQVLAFPDAVLIERLWQDWVAGFWGKIWLTAFWEAPQRQSMWQFYVSDQLYARAEAIGLAEEGDPGIASKALDLVRVIEDARSGSL